MALREQRLDREAKFGAAAWSAARIATRSSQTLFNRARFWIGLLAGVNSSEYARYWAHGAVPRTTGRLPRQTRTYCPDVVQKLTSAFDSVTMPNSNLVPLIPLLFYITY